MAVVSPSEKMMKIGNISEKAIKSLNNQAKIGSTEVKNPFPRRTRKIMNFKNL